MQQLYLEKEQNAVLMDVWDLDLVLVNVSLMPFYPKSAGEATGTLLDHKGDFSLGGDLPLQMNALVGFAICFFTACLGIYMVVDGIRRKRHLCATPSAEAERAGPPTTDAAATDPKA